MAPSGHRLLTVPEAADTLHVCRATLYELIRTGQLPSLKIGKARRISEAAVATFIADRTVGGDTP